MNLFALGIKIAVIVLTVTLIWIELRFPGA